MKEQEFLDKVWKSKVSIYRKKSDPQNRDWFKKRDGYECARIYKNNLPKMSDAVLEEWCSGGVSGGSCWDDGKDDPHYPMEGQPEPEFTSIDGLISFLCPDISFMNYKKIMAKVVKTESYSQNEYYGNSTNYTYKYAILKDLFDILNNMKLI
jgi:hypothetical protein